MMYSVAVYESNNACVTVYTYDKDSAMKLFRDAIGTCERVILYQGADKIGEWEDIK